MVFFCCNGCGESLKKAKVEHHPCRHTVSCMDCNVTFTGQEYKKHTTCVTEAQRYQGHLYQEKENKGAVKQNSWMSIVKEAADNCKNNAALKGLLVRIAENDNVPRKRAKFINFIRNSMRVNSKHLVEEAWSAIEAGKTAKESEAVKQEEVVKEAVECTKPLKKKKIKSAEKVEAANSKHDVVKKKRKRKNGNNVAVDEFTTKKTKDSTMLSPNMNRENGIAPETPGKTKSYKITTHIQEIVFEKEEISLKKLKRKVTAAYLESKPYKSEEEASRLFDKKVHKVPGVAVDHSVVRKELLDVVESD